MVYVFLAEGFEEVEALTPVDLLRRCGVTVKTVGVTGKTVTSSHQVPIVADVEPAEVDLSDAQMIFLPGGLPGAHNLRASNFVCACIDKMNTRGRYIAAICAAPSVVLGDLGLLNGRCATCYPGMESGMKGAEAQSVPCVQDGHFITGRGAGAAFELGLKMCEALCGKQKADELAAAVCYER